MEKNQHERLNDLIKDIRIAMLTTRDEHGGLRSRPMATQKERFDGDLWFFTSEHTGKSGEIQNDQCVNLSYSEPSAQKYVSVSGRAQIVKDREKMEAMWNPFYRAWFPQGLDDPELALLRVSVERAELWDAPPSMVVHVIGAAKAVITGDKGFKDDAAYHAKLGFESPNPAAATPRGEGGRESRSH